MEYIKTDIEGVYILKPRLFNDARGYFTETYKKEDFDLNVGRPVEFVQDNQSMSSRGVLRGLHYQEGKDSQAKLVRVIQGSVLDVAVDLRKGSPTFGKYVMVELSAENMQQLFVPRGFAHGFYVLSEQASFINKVDNRYAPQSERTLAYNDPTVNIKWPISDTNPPLLSDKDLNKALSLDEVVPFEDFSN